MKLFRKAANQGYAGAQYNLGLMYTYGKGIKQNYAEAKKIFGLACNNEYENGCYNYRILNEQGY